MLGNHARSGGPISQIKGTHFLNIPRGEPPYLIVGIDTEAEFDWNQPFSRSKTCVDSVSQQHLAHDIFDRFGVIPTYLVDYAVATNDAAVKVLREYQEAGRCEIGAHLNPWINPPYEEHVGAFHSYACNLPNGLERRKLELLTGRIEEQFGNRPRVYRAGRYGIGQGTPAILEDLGYRIDMSVVPFTSFDRDGGPDFCDFDYRPYWIGSERRLLEIPVTCGFAGSISGMGHRLFPLLSSRVGMWLRLPGVLARLRALERIRLTPEGISFSELRRLTQSLLNAGCRIFSFTYHSPSLAPDNTPYVHDKSELVALLQTIDQYCGYFMDELGGKPSTPIDICSRFKDSEPLAPSAQD